MRALVLVFALGAGIAAAQEPVQFAWWDRPIARTLNLGPEQQKQIRATVREFRDRLIEQQAAVRKAEANLADLMDEDQINEARTRDAIEKVVAARGDLLRTISQMALKMRTVLTPEQWQRVQQRRAGQLLERRQQRLRGAQPAPVKPGPQGPPAGPVY